MSEAKGVLVTASFDLNEILNEGRNNFFNTPIVCVDGYRVSIQCAKYNYCSPRKNMVNVDLYTSFELGFPNEADEIINGYAEDSGDYTGTVYGYVPRDVVTALIKKHGGVDLEIQEALKVLN